MWMLHSLQHFHFVVHHLLIAFDILLENNFDSALALRAVGLADYAICTSAECLSESIFGSKAEFSMGELSNVMGGRTSCRSCQAGRAAC